MCGRYALVKSAGELIEEFEITTNSIPAALPADWNIAPTREIYVIRNLRDIRDVREDVSENRRELATLSWGMIAPWSKDRSEAVRSQSQAINARSESVHEKPTFRSAFKSRRCLIPASGYYEWATELGKYESKQPFFIQSDIEGKSLAFAGIYDRWVDSSGKIFESASIITRPAVDFLAKIHNRMPTFLPVNRWDAWLDPKLNSVEEIQKLMELSEPAKGLRAHPVSTRVNATRNNGADLISEIDVSEPNTLF
ncbi:MAG: SOS response-associated peptidase [Actinomycetota bacterium]|nr:SOS response-associated peptidase [Actinomycetota bacterium]MDA2996885.1 SOS response-associated peptidase [Actinomycetota bacterium]